MAYNDKGDMLPFDDDPMIRHSVAWTSVLILFEFLPKHVLASPKYAWHILNTP